MSEQPEAPRLADTIEEDPTTTWGYREAAHAAAAELRRLHADVEELDGLRERLADLLSRTAVALKGPEPPLTRWDWSDLPERAMSLRAERSAADEIISDLLEALKALIDEQEGPPLIRRHRQWQAAVDACRAAIKKAEGQA